MSCPCLSIAAFFSSCRYLYLAGNFFFLFVQSLHVSFLFSGGAQKPPHRTSSLLMPISPSPDSGHASARSLCLIPSFCPQRKPPIFCFLILTSNTGTGVAAVAAQAQAQASALNCQKKLQALLAKQTLLRPTVWNPLGNQVEKAGRGEAEPATPSACIATNRFLVTRAAASHQHKAQATARFFFGFSGFAAFSGAPFEALDGIYTWLVSCSKSVSSLAKYMYSTQIP